MTPSPHPVRHRFRDRLLARFAVRFHTTLILLGTIAAGVGASRVLRALGVTTLTWRPVLSTLVAYGAFFVLVRLWVAYAQSADAAAKLTADEARELAPRDAEPSPRPERRRRRSGALDELGSLAELDLIALVVSVVALLSIGAWVVYEAPLVLVDAAFEVVLAAGVSRATRRFGTDGFTLGVLRATWVPALLAVLLALGAGLWLGFSACPGQETLAACLRG